MYVEREREDLIEPRPSYIASLIPRTPWLTSGSILSLAFVALRQPGRQLLHVMHRRLHIQGRLVA